MGDRLSDLAGATHEEAVRLRREIEAGEGDRLRGKIRELQGTLFKHEIMNAFGLPYSKDGQMTIPSNRDSTVEHVWEVRSGLWQRLGEVMAEHSLEAPVNWRELVQQGIDADIANERVGQASQDRGLTQTFFAVAGLIGDAVIAAEAKAQQEPEAGIKLVTRYGVPVTTPAGGAVPAAEAA